MIRIGDKFNDKLRIPPEYRQRIVEVRKYCTKPELEMLLIISEGLEAEYEKVKSSTTPKAFVKQKIMYQRKKYNNSTQFYHDYYGGRVDLLVESITKYRQLKGKHQKGELYLAELLK